MGNRINILKIYFILASYGGTTLFIPVSGGRSRQTSEFKASLVYIANSGTARATQRNPVSKKQNNTEKILFCYWFFCLFSFLRQGFSVALKPVLELVLVDQAGLKLRDLPASPFWVLGLKAYATTAWLCFVFVFVFQDRISL
ncbi:hypothetical protein ACRRTK_007951 [Alexandromys fortis]